MDGDAVNLFLDRFLGVLDTGFGLIAGDVGYVLNALIVISIVLAGAQWALAQEAPLGPFFRKVLFVGLFAFLINNWNALAMAIASSGAMLGLKAGGGAMSVEDLHNPARIAEIGGDLFARTAELGEGMNIFTDFIPLATVFIAALLVMLGFFALALQIFVALIAFKLGALAAFVALPWGVFNGTAWVAERPLGWVAGAAMRLFVLALIASAALSFVETLPPNFALDDGGALAILFFGLSILALSWFGPHLASEVVSGQPNLGAAHVTGAAAVGAGAAVFAGGAAIRGGGALIRAGRSHRSARASAPRASINHAQIKPPRSRHP